MFCFKSRLRPLLVTCAAGLLLAAPGFAAATQDPDLPTFAIVAKGGLLQPETLEVPAGKKVRLALRNEGPGAIEFENSDLRIEKVVAPGASAFVVVRPLKPGSYRFVDEFHAATGSMQLIAK